ncbi:MAG TPA: TatD family hydrolase [Actinomycetota bacterium]|nr:TatD family hydrolase [Actinomycetota bacterium]
MLVDTHCHLSMLEEGVEAVLGRARAAGVGHVVDVGVDLESSRTAAANAGRFEGVSATAGVHPHDAVRLTPETLRALRELLAGERVVAVGETGLDYFRDHSPRDVQRAAFATHVRLARELDKALVVHCREAFAEVMAILDSEGAPPRVVMHCFSGDAAMAERVLAAGYHVSFAGTVTFKNAPRLREACAVVPLDRMVLETDSPYLSPHPFRGRPNSPERLAVTAQTVAAVHGVDVERVAEATTATAAHAFRLRLGAPRGAA